MDPFGLRGSARKGAPQGDDRLPPGQKQVENWPVLTYGATPRIDLKDWRLRIWGLVEEVTFTWEELMALPQVEIVRDIHCVTSWSRFDTRWEGVSSQDLMKHVRLKPQACAVMVHSYGGYTTNLLLEDFLKDGVLLAHRHDGEPLAPEHGGPLRLVVPHLYFWKSAKWVRGLEFLPEDGPGFWERYGYHIRGDPWQEERYS
ncbi:MAG TPA: sulfite oxidase-like oxidoreductase [Dehalococcoidia bacterium]|nr:sulfite oxidase-like oxidoreductase [Dehalococcoidia bacterium]